jgi:hypothetical protein
MRKEERLCKTTKHIMRCPYPHSCQKIAAFYRIRRAGIAQSVQRLATGCTVRRSNPVRGEIFHTRLDRPLGQPNPLYNGYRVIPGYMAARTWRWPPTPASAEVKERVELYLNSTSGPSWSILGRKLYYRILTGVQDSHLQRVTIPEAAYIQLRRRPPEDEQGNSRNM